MRRLTAAGLLPERAGQPVKAWAHISLADLLRLDGARREADAPGIACDAAMAPIVTGDVNVDALDDLVRLCVELDARRRDGTRDAAWAAIGEAVIGKAVDLVPGPGGLASFLRRRELGVRLGGPSLPLDIGYAES